jgi:outer membrane protein assembly factor BamB
MKGISISYRLVVFAFLSILLCGPALQAADDNVWPVFKGSAERNGVSDSNSVDLPFKIAWVHTPEGKSNGFVDWGPVAAGGVIYTGDGLNNVLALNAKTGEIVWTKQVISNIFSVSLSEDASKLYVTTAITTKPTATLYVLNPQTGELLWDNMVNGQSAIGGIEGAPAIADGKIFTGYLQYEGHGGVTAYDAATGGLLWHWKVERFSPYSSITYSNGFIYVGFENKRIVCLNASNGQVAWSQILSDLPYSAPLAFDKKIFIGTGSSLYALDARTGQIMWQKTLEGITIGHSSVSVHDHILYVGSRESKVMAFTANEGNLLWTKDLQKGAIESSAIIDAKKKVLYIGTQQNWLYALSLKDGDIKGEIQLSQDERGVWKSAPALHDGKLYIGALDKSLYAVE